MSSDPQSADLFVSCESFPTESHIVPQPNIVMPRIFFSSTHGTNARPPRRKSSNPEHPVSYPQPPQQHYQQQGYLKQPDPTTPPPPPTTTTSKISMTKSRTKATLSTKGVSALATPGIAASQVTLSTIPLGRGSFGSVWRGTFAGSPVAIKVCPLINPDNRGEQTLKERKSALQHFNRETKRFYHLRHPCIVQFFCVVHHAPSNSLLLVTELMKGGSLYDGLSALRKGGAKALPLRVMLRLGIHIANGLAYLHACEFSFGDLKSMNVLLSEPPDMNTLSFSRSTQAKLCDFGLSRNLNRLVPMETHVPGRNGPAGTFAYLAPEAFSGLPVDDGAAPKAADVYALAVVLWELATLRSPWPGKQPLQLLRLVVKEGRRPPWGSVAQGGVLPNGYVALVEACWQKDARSRPTAAQVAAALAAMLEAVDEAPLSPVQGLATGYRKRSLSSLSDSHRALALAFGADLKANLKQPQLQASPPFSESPPSREFSRLSVDVHDSMKNDCDAVAVRKHSDDGVEVFDELDVEGCTRVTDEDDSDDDGSDDNDKDHVDDDDDLGSDIVDAVISSDDENENNENDSGDNDDGDDSDSPNDTLHRSIKHAAHSASLLHSAMHSQTSSVSSVHPHSVTTHVHSPRLSSVESTAVDGVQSAECKPDQVAGPGLLLGDESIHKASGSAFVHFMNSANETAPTTKSNLPLSSPSYKRSGHEVHRRSSSSTTSTSQWLENSKDKMDDLHQFAGNFIIRNHGDNDEEDDDEEFFSDFKVYKTFSPDGTKAGTLSVASSRSEPLSLACRDELATVISDVSSMSHRTHATASSSVESNPSLPVHPRETDAAPPRRYIMPHVDSNVVAVELSELERENEMAFDSVAFSMLGRGHLR